MIVRIAREGGTDAVFEVPPQVLRGRPGDQPVAVALSDDPEIRTTGRVREVSPQADPVTGTFTVRVALESPPAEMLLGSVVNGSVTLGSDDVIVIPVGGPDQREWQAGGLGREPRRLHRRAAGHPRAQARGQFPDHRRRARARRYRRNGRRTGAASRPEGSPARPDVLMGPNLSSWALSHRSFIIFLMVVSIVAGAISYVTLGRDEDPPFTFRTMVVQANWPGASMDETLKQLTERLERTLQEVDNIDFLRSFTSPGVAVIFVNLDDSTDPEDVPDLWYDVRKRVGDMRHTLPQGRAGPVLQRRVRRHLRHHLRLYHRRLRPAGAARLRGGRALQAALGAGCVDGGPDRCAGRADLHRFQHGAARRARPQPGGDPRGARGAERGAPRRHHPHRGGAVLAAGERGLRVGPGRPGCELPRQRPAAPAARRGDDPPRLCRPAADAVPRQRHAGHRARHRHERGRRRARARRERPGGDRRDQAGPARRHRAGAGRQPAAGRRYRDQRVHGVAVAGDRHHPGRELHCARCARWPDSRALHPA